MNDDDLMNKLDISVRYSISLSTMVRKKLDHHLQILKSLREPDNSQKTWIIKAIKEKISREDPQEVTKGKSLHLLLENSIFQALDERLTEISKTHPSYSKKQWVIDAIEEKLEAEKEMVEKALEEFRSNFQK